MKTEQSCLKRAKRATIFTFILRKSHIFPIHFHSNELIGANNVGRSVGLEIPFNDKPVNSARPSTPPVPSLDGRRKESQDTFFYRR